MNPEDRLELVDHFYELDLVDEVVHPGAMGLGVD
jgi:hypothetical protein